MEKTVLTVCGEYASEKIIEKSRFLTYSAHVEGEEEARAFIAKIRSAHTLATHCCYAFIADKLGNLQRFSDDGEPQGTAGVPILEVLKNKKLFETAVAVVRYFGGVKLGAGGLVRAYSSSAAENLADADIRSLEMCSELLIEVEYTGVDGVQKYLSLRPCSLLSTDYGEKVTFTLAVKKAEETAFIDGLIDYMQGKVQTQKKSEYYAAFKIQS
ncbi:MAG: YigZ family protein [Clostridia bacterium]|nr:YigZ family protein [Clostridia bacterium]